MYDKISYGREASVLGRVCLQDCGNSAWEEMEAAAQEEGWLREELGNKGNLEKQSVRKIKHQ